MTHGSPKACTNFAPLWAIKLAATSSRDSVARSYSTTRAPSAFVASSFIRGALDGMTIVAAIPSFFAAHATPWAWFPLDTPTTPRARSASFRSDSRCQAPRILNAPTGCSISALHQSVTPSTSSGNNGVLGRIAAILVIARCTPSCVGVLMAAANSCPVIKGPYMRALNESLIRGNCR